MAGKSSKTGRPSGCSKELTDKIAKHVRDGLSASDAAFLEGVPKSTLYDWMKRESAFSDAITRARILRKKDMVEGVKAGIMASGKKGDWKAYMRLLESWEAEEYATTQQIEMRVKNEHGDFLAVAREVLPDEMWAVLLDAYVRRYGGGEIEDPAGELVH